MCSILRMSGGAIVRRVREAAAAALWHLNDIYLRVRCHAHSGGKGLMQAQVADRMAAALTDLTSEQNRPHLATVLSNNSRFLIWLGEFPGKLYETQKALISLSNRALWNLFTQKSLDFGKKTKKRPSCSFNPAGRLS